MPIEERLELSIDDALSRIDQAGQAVEDRFDQAATSFKVALAEALDVLKTVEVNADASGVTTSIDQAVVAADTTPTITADASEVTTGIDQAVNAADATPVINADTTAIAPEIDQAVAGADAVVHLEADTSGVDEALSNVTDEASRAGTAGHEAAGGLGAIAPAAALATGELGATTDILGEVTPGLAGATAATGGLVLAGKQLFDSALEQNTALARLKEQFGPLADAVEHVHLGGLNEDLDHLAVRTGADVDGLRNFAASFGQLGKSAGDSTPHIAEVATQINALAVRASVLNPNLGTADEIVQRLSTSLARGGRFLAAYGISLSTAQINAEALAETGKQTASDLTIYEKEVAGATLATKQLGTSLGSDINSGAQKAQVQLRALKAAFDETLKSAGAPLIQPTIDAFKDLEPILGSLATILGAGLAGALHVVGPLLGVVASALQAIPTPVALAVVGFLAFQRIGPLVADAGRAVASFAVGMVRDMSIADIAATAGVGGIIAAFVLLVNQMRETEQRSKDAANAFAQSLGGVNVDTLSAFEKKIADLKDRTKDFTNFIQLNPLSFFTKGTDAQDQIKQLQGLIDKAQEAAHTTLTQAVATDSLSRSLEVDTIRVNTTKDGHVNWLNVLKTLKPVIDSNTNATDSYGNALTQQTSAAKTAADASQDVARAQLLTLVASGQLKQSQLEQVTALHQTKDGATDYAGALKEINPAAAAVAADIATIAGGLDTQATRFRLAKDQAALYKEGFDQLVQPTLDADTAQLGFQKIIEGVTSKLADATVKADAYKVGISTILDPVLAAQEGNLKLFDALDKTNKTLADNKGATDVKIQAGRDDQQAVIDLVRAYDSAIDAQIRSGESTAIVQRSRDEEIAKLHDLERAYPGLKAQIDEQVTALGQANNQTAIASRVTEEHRASLDQIITAGEKWVETLIATGAPTEAVNAARQQEIDKLNGLKAQYPELSGVIDGYIAKLQAIPPSKDTTVNLLNVIQTEVDLANIHTAINELQDKHIAVTADTVQAQLAADALDRTLADIRRGANFVGGFQSAGSQGSRMAGGPIWPGEWLVGEAGPERLFISQGGTGWVVPNGTSTTTAAPSAGPQIDYERLARAIAAVRPNNISVTEVAQNPQATAAAVDARLGARVNF